MTILARRPCATSGAIAAIAALSSASGPMKLSCRISRHFSLLGSGSLVGGSCGGMSTMPSSVICRVASPSANWRTESSTVMSTSIQVCAAPSAAGNSSHSPRRRLASRAARTSVSPAAASL
jgi:hypothetical protein